MSTRRDAPFPEWVLVLEDPGITADPEPYYTGRYLDGVEVTLTATPPEGYHLSGWTGDLSGTVNPETLEMDGNKAVGAVYAKDGHTLTVACDGDEGSVAVYLNASTTPATGVNGVYDVEWGDAVRLVAAPVVDTVNGVYYRFAGWTDVPGNPATAEAEFTVSGNLSVAAAFQQQYLVTLGVTGAGNAWISSGDPAQTLLGLTGDGTQPGPSDSVLVDAGTVLTAHAGVDTQGGWYLEDWTVDSVFQLSSVATLSLGACAANVAVAAVFAEQYTVTVEVYPATIDAGDPAAPAPGEITLACSDPVSCGTFEALGTPTEGAALEWRFKRWRGKWNGGIWVTLGHLNPQEITLTGDLLLRGEFEKYYLPDDLQALLNYTGWSVFFQTAQLALSEPCNGHVIPDVVYMGLVDWMLDNANAPLHAEVSAAYWENMETLQAWFDGVEQQNAALGYTRPDTPVISALAAAAVYSQNSYAMLSFMAWVKEKALWPGFATTLVSFPELDTLSGLAACADVDGDGFSNAEEWLYFDWVTGGLLGTAADWEGASSTLFRLMVGLPVLEAGSAVNVPDMTTFANIPGAPPTVTVTIVRGGDGGLVYPPQGTYQLPKYNLTDWWVRNSNGSYSPRADQCAECEFANVALTANDDGDWSFSHWYAPPSVLEAMAQQTLDADSMAGIWKQHDLSLDLSEDRGTVAHFAHREGLQNLDLGLDLALFLHGQGFISDPSEVLSSGFDRGGVVRGAFGARTYTGDGIPDAAQFALLEAVLVKTGLSLGQRGGMENFTAWENFRENQLEAQSVLGAFPSHVQNTVAAYLTIGSEEMRMWLENFFLERHSVDLDEGYFGSVCGEHLSAEGDADRDGYTNAQEWEYVNMPEEEKSASMPPSTGDVVSDFVRSALDPDSPGDDPPPGGNTPPSEPCFNDSCSSKASVSVEIAQGVVARVKDPGGEERTLAQSDSVYRGREIKVEYTGPREPFFTWNIPGSQMDGCNLISGEFRLSGTQQHIGINQRGWQGVGLIGSEQIEVLPPQTLSGAPCQIHRHPVGSYITGVSYYSGLDVRLAAKSRDPQADRILKWDEASTGKTFSFGAFPVMQMKAYSNGYYASYFIKPDRYRYRFHPIHVQGGNGYAGALEHLYATGDAPFRGGVATYNDCYPFPTGYYDEPQTVQFRIDPFPGYHLYKFSDSVDGERGAAPLGLTGNMWKVTSQSPITARAECKKKVRLTLKTRVEGAECDDACAGSVVASPGKYYYIGGFNGGSEEFEKSTGEVVTIMAIPNPGFRFLYWEGEGGAYMSRDENNALSDFRSINGAPTARQADGEVYSKDPNITSPVMYTEMNLRKADSLLDPGIYQSSDREITAVFAPELFFSAHVYAPNEDHCIQGSALGGHSWWSLEVGPCCQNLFTSQELAVTGLNGLEENGGVLVSLLNTPIGFYPTLYGINIAECKGEIKIPDPKNSTPHDVWRFPITKAQFLNALQASDDLVYASNREGSTVLYILCLFNCTDMAVSIGLTAGIAGLDPGTTPFCLNGLQGRCPGKWKGYLNRLFPTYHRGS